MKINEVAKLTGITVRTLHYYDEIGLLKPSKVTDKGYRIYDQQSLEILQQILFFRELEFPLNQIKQIINDSKFNSQKALINHRDLLIKKRERLDNIINLVNKKLEGGTIMSFKEFDTTEIEKCKEKYAKEVKEKYGDTNEYRQSQQKASKYTKEDWNKIQEEANYIMKQFFNNKEKPIDSDEIKELVKKWQDHITKYYYDCSNKILAGLGSMYVADERFKNNIDKNGKGTAEFMSKAIASYCK